MGEGEYAPLQSRPGCPLPLPPVPATVSQPLLLSPHMSHLQMAVLRSSCPSDSCRLGSPGRRSVLFPGARGRRKLARLRVAKRPRRRRELDEPHLLRERPGRAGPGPRLARHRRTKHSRDGLEGRAPKQAGRSGGKECGSILAREIIKKFMFTVRIHMTDSGQWKGRTTHKVVLQSCKFS